MKRLIESTLLFILAFMFLLMPNTFSQNWINFILCLWISNLITRDVGDDK